MYTTMPVGSSIDTKINNENKQNKSELYTCMRKESRPN